MLSQEGLSPTLNKYPDFEGEKVEDLTVWNPFIMITTYGPDDGLTSVELVTHLSTDSNEVYWQDYVFLWVLTAVFPDWDNREEWLNRTIRSLAAGVASDKLSFERNGYTIQPAELFQRAKLGRKGGYPFTFFLAIAVAETE